MRGGPGAHGHVDLDRSERHGVSRRGISPKRGYHSPSTDELPVGVRDAGGRSRWKRAAVWLRPEEGRTIRPIPRYARPLVAAIPGKYHRVRAAGDYRCVVHDHPTCLPLKLSTARIMAMMFSTGVRA